MGVGQRTAVVPAGPGRADEHEGLIVYWLFKTEPSVWSWDDQVGKAAEGEAWDGVRNHQANNNMKAMRRGERGFFYHSQTERAVVGVVEVIREWAPDPKDASGRFGMVTVQAVAPFARAVTLAEIKAEPRLAEMALGKNSRLSGQPVEAAEWAVVCGMGGVAP